MSLQWKAYMHTNLTKLGPTNIVTTTASCTPLLNDSTQIKATTGRRMRSGKGSTTKLHTIKDNSILKKQKYKKISPAHIHVVFQANSNVQIFGCKLAFISFKCQTVGKLTLSPKMVFSALLRRNKKQQVCT